RVPSSPRAMASLVTCRRSRSRWPTPGLPIASSASLASPDRITRRNAAIRLDEASRQGRGPRLDRGSGLGSALTPGGSLRIIPTLLPTRPWGSDRRQELPALGVGAGDEA